MANDAGPQMDCGRRGARPPRPVHRRLCRAWHAAVSSTACSCAVAAWWTRLGTARPETIARLPTGLTVLGEW